MRNIGIGLALCAGMVLLGGCASGERLSRLETSVTQAQASAEEARAMAAQAQRTADEALAAARRAQASADAATGTARDAKASADQARGEARAAAQAAQAADEKAGRMFKKSVTK